jgi:hypothetical protein
MNPWGKAALCCSAFSLILHVMSFIVPAAVGQAGGVHLGVPLCLGAAVFVAAAVNAFREDTGKAPGHLPLWAVLLGITAFMYATANFLIVHWLLEGAAPERIGDAYVLSDHGRILREVTSAEYWRLRGYESRILSGSAMAYAFLAALYLLYLRPPVHTAPPNQTLQPTFGPNEGTVV